MGSLQDKRCVVLPKGTPPLSLKAIAELEAQVAEWKVVDGTKLSREYKFKTYMDGARWVPLLGAIADSEDHHPDVHLFYRRVVVELWTHTVNGLSENDFILAAKLDRAYDTWPGKNS
jgi:4a-hydroxytetrahydrobiopterin dehydratase